ncbi:MAG: DUF5723 family protein [Bacteroidota bacterium]
MLRIYLFLSLIFLTLSLEAQEMLGMTTGTFAGTHGVLLNPSSMIGSRQYLDLQVFGIAVFEDNNYLYIPKAQYSLHNLTHKEAQMYTEEHPSPDKYTVYDWYTKIPKQVYSSEHIMTPGFMFSYENQGFAFQTQVRNILSLHNIPYHVAKFTIEGLSFTPQQHIEYTTGKFQISELSMAEMDFSYANRIYQKDYDQISIGVTAKRLRGIAGVNVLIKDANYMAPSHDTLYVYNLDATIGLSVPLDHQTNDITINDQYFRGKGWGWDFGIYYQRNVAKTPKTKRMVPSLCGQVYQDYRYKIGVSLLDFGKIHFDQQADLLRFDNVGTFWPGIDKTKYKNIDEAKHDLSNRFYGDSTAAILAHDFYMPLPTMLSLQYDQNLGGGFYLNSVFMVNLPLYPDLPYRPSQLAVIPRYDTRNFGLSMPVSLYDYNKLRLGICLRLYSFTLGTDMISPYIRKLNFTGIDFYGSIKISLNKGYCANKGRVKHCGNAEYLNFLRNKHHKSTRHYLNIESVPQ